MKSCCLMLGHIIGAHLVYTPGLLKLAQPFPLSTRHIYKVWCSPLFDDVMLYIMHGWQNMNNQWHCNAVSSRSRRLVAISSTDLLTTPIYTISSPADHPNIYYRTSISSPADHPNQESFVLHPPSLLYLHPPVDVECGLNANIRMFHEDNQSQTS